MESQNEDRTDFIPAALKPLSIIFHKQDRTRTTTAQGHIRKKIEPLNLRTGSEVGRQFKRSNQNAQQKQNLDLLFLQGSPQQFMHKRNTRGKSTFKGTDADSSDRHQITVTKPAAARTAQGRQRKNMAATALSHYSTLNQNVSDVFVSTQTSQSGGLNSRLHKIRKNFRALGYRNLLSSENTFTQPATLTHDKMGADIPPLTPAEPAELKEAEVQKNEDEAELPDNPKIQFQSFDSHKSSFGKKQMAQKSKSRQSEFGQFLQIQGAGTRMKAQHQMSLLAKTISSQREGLTTNVEYVNYIQDIQIPTEESHHNIVVNSFHRTATPFNETQLCSASSRQINKRANKGTGGNYGNSGNNQGSQRWSSVGQQTMGIQISKNDGDDFENSQRDTARGGSMEWSRRERRAGQSIHARQREKAKRMHTTKIVNQKQEQQVILNFKRRDKSVSHILQQFGLNKHDSEASSIVDQQKEKKVWGGSMHIDVKVKAGLNRSKQVKNENLVRKSHDEIQRTLQSEHKARESPTPKSRKRKAPKMKFKPRISTEQDMPSEAKEEDAFEESAQAMLGGKKIVISEEKAPSIDEIKEVELGANTMSNATPDPPAKNRISGTQVKHPRTQTVRSPKSVRSKKSESSPENTAKVHSRAKFQRPVTVPALNTSPGVHVDFGSRLNIFTGAYPPLPDAKPKDYELSSDNSMEQSKMVTLENVKTVGIEDDIMAMRQSHGKQALDEAIAAQGKTLKNQRQEIKKLTQRLRHHVLPITSEQRLSKAGDKIPAMFVELNPDSPAPCIIEMFGAEKRQVVTQEADEFGNEKAKIGYEAVSFPVFVKVPSCPFNTKLFFSVRQVDPRELEGQGNRLSNFLLGQQKVSRRDTRSLSVRRSSILDATGRSFSSMERRSLVGKVSFIMKEEHLQTFQPADIRIYSSNTIKNPTSNKHDRKVAVRDWKPVAGAALSSFVLMNSDVHGRQQDSDPEVKDLYLSFDADVSCTLLVWISTQQGMDQKRREQTDKKKESMPARRKSPSKRGDLTVKEIKEINDELGEYYQANKHLIDSHTNRKDFVGDYVHKLKTYPKQFSQAFRQYKINMQSSINQENHKLARLRSRQRSRHKREEIIESMTKWKSYKFKLETSKEVLVGLHKKRMLAKRFITLSVIAVLSTKLKMIREKIDAVKKYKQACLFMGLKSFIMISRCLKKFGGTFDSRLRKRNIFPSVSLLGATLVPIKEERAKQILFNALTRTLCQRVLSNQVRKFHQKIHHIQKFYSARKTQRMFCTKYIRASFEREKKVVYEYFAKNNTSLLSKKFLMRSPLLTLDFINELLDHLQEMQGLEQMKGYYEKKILFLRLYSRVFRVNIENQTFIRKYAMEKRILNRNKDCYYRIDPKLRFPHTQRMTGRIQIGEDREIDEDLFREEISMKMKSFDREINIMKLKIANVQKQIRVIRRALIASEGLAGEEILQEMQALSIKNQFKSLQKRMKKQKTKSRMNLPFESISSTSIPPATEKNLEDIIAMPTLNPKSRRKEKIASLQDFYSEIVAIHFQQEEQSSVTLKKQKSTASYGSAKRGGSRSGARRTSIRLEVGSPTSPKQRDPAPVFQTEPIIEEGIGINPKEKPFLECIGDYYAQAKYSDDYFLLRLSDLVKLYFKFTQGHVPFFKHIYEDPALGLPHLKPSRQQLHRMIIRACAKYKPSDPTDLFRPIKEMREGKAKEDVSYDGDMNTLTSIEGSSLRLSQAEISEEALSEHPHPDHPDHPDHG